MVRQAHHERVITAGMGKGGTVYTTAKPCAKHIPPSLLHETRKSADLRVFCWKQSDNSGHFSTSIALPSQAPPNKYRLKPKFSGVDKPTGYTAIHGMKIACHAIHDGIIKHHAGYYAKLGTVPQKLPKKASNWHPIGARPHSWMFVENNNPIVTGHNKP
ncbi:MAG: hypothetical protein EPN21_17450 [Methylococcaceae bacterium]|nr:MAG: hypothetical protein EPN21_17450 [Methylococcaceae bacterium]